MSSAAQRRTVKRDDVSRLALLSIQKLLTLRANHNDIDMIEKAPVSNQLGGSQGYVRAEVPYFPALELCNGMIGVSK